MRSSRVQGCEGCYSRPILGIQKSAENQTMVQPAAEHSLLGDLALMAFALGMLNPFFTRVVGLRDRDASG